MSGSHLGRALGSPRLHLRATDSTNERARALALAGAPHGTLVTAGEQSTGRGRQGRTWSAPAGYALLASLVLRDPPRLLPLVAAVAAAEVAEAHGGQAAAIKWPNDVLLAGEAGAPPRKVAGILVEGRPQERWAVLGVGVNVAVRVEDLPAELHATAATLGLEPTDVELVLADLLAALRRRLAEAEPDVLAAWRERDALRGHAVSWSAGSGTAAGIDDDGRLLVTRANGGTDALDAGEVHLTR